MVGPKATGTWGDLVITENKTMSYVGLNGVNGKQVKIGAITFSPATGGLNINRNEHFFSNLLVTGSFASQAVLFSGTGAGRMRFAGCFINNTSATGDGVVNSNTFNTGTTSSLWLDNTTVLVTTTSGVAIRQSGQYTFVKNRCDISGGASAVVLTAGTFESVGATLEMNGTGSVIDVSATLPTAASCLLGYSTVRNTTTNGSGVTLTGNGAVLSAGDAAFIVATAAASTIAVGSNGQALPQATINVASAVAFAPTGSLFVTTSAGSQTVTYTGKTATSFTGCSGGTGTMTTGGAVTQKGIGYCVKGTGTFLYAQNIFSNSAAVSYNVRVQVPGITALPVATAFTPTP